MPKAALDALKKHKEKSEDKEDKKDVKDVKEWICTKTILKKIRSNGCRLRYESLLTK